jgi:hypothetical protein
LRKLFNKTDYFFGDPVIISFFLNLAVREGFRVSIKSCRYKEEIWFEVFQGREPSLFNTFSQFMRTGVGRKGRIYNSIGVFVGEILPVGVLKN